MAYEAKVLQVFIASPGDVSEEREIVRGVISDWNYVHASERRAILLPVGWETHAAPAMGSPAQELINNRVLTECDLLIGIFWTRLGTPTSAAASGTVEEIERHLAAGKPAMLYFSTRPVELSSVDPEQLSAVRAFRAKLTAEQRGLLGSFDSTTDFRDRFANDLQLTLRDEPLLKRILAAPLPAPGGFGTPVVIRDLAPQAKKLLTLAAHSEDGVVLRVETIGATGLQIDGVLYGTGGRDTARWLFALQQLIDEGLLEDRGGYNSLFHVTEPGYQKAEKIDAESERAGENGADS